MICPSVNLISSFCPPLLLGKTLTQIGGGNGSQVKKADIRTSHRDPSISQKAGEQSQNSQRTQFGRLYLWEKTA